MPCVTPDLLCCVFFPCVCASMCPHNCLPARSGLALHAGCHIARGCGSFAPLRGLVSGRGSKECRGYICMPEERLYCRVPMLQRAPPTTLLGTHYLNRRVGCAGQGKIW